MTVATNTGKAQQLFSRFGALLVICLAQSACISTTESVFTENASPEKALEGRVELARLYIGEGNWDDAKRNLELAADIDADNAEVHEAFALVFQSTGEYELAEEHFKNAVKLDRKLSRARNNYAAFLFSQQRFAEAQEQLEEVIKDTQYNARANAFVNLGLCRLQLNNKQGAQEAFMRAIAIDRGSQIASLELAQLNYDAQDFRSASQYYNNYRKLVRQQNARALLLGIRLAGESGDKDAEASYALALSSMFPNSPEYESYQQGEGRN
jgi:type IV pilus assembly protein PilF